MDARVYCCAPCGKVPTYSTFYDCFYGLQVPEGSTKQRGESGSIPLNQNMLVDTAIEGNYTHIFMVEDDSSFAPDTLLRLLKHDVPVVAGLCRSRQPPYRPYIYGGISDEGVQWYKLRCDKITGLIGPSDGVRGVGMGGILINLEVFKKLKRPYFHHYFVGEKEWGQDIVFNKQLMDNNIEVYCDLDVTIWHNTTCTVGTEVIDGKLKIIFRVSGNNISVDHPFEI